MKKIISMLLVVALVVAMAAIGMATTSAAQTASITIYDLNGNAVTEEYEVGEEFTVYTTLDASTSAPGGMIGSVQGTQTYSANVLQLVNEVSGEYGEFTEISTVFPITRDATIANASVAGKIAFNASIPSKTDAFKFDSSAAKLIVTTFKVTSAGAGEVKNTIKNLAVADDDLTRIVYEGKTQTGKTYSVASTFTDPLAFDHAEITVHAIDGTTETIEANVGEQVTVYTTLKVGNNNGKISSINAVQKYTSSVLALDDALDEDGLIDDTDKVFPILGDKALANGETKGQIKYSASTPYVNKPFVFDDDNCQLIVTTFKVKSNGVAEITNIINTLATAEDPVKTIIKGGVAQEGADVALGATFTDPSGPTPTTLTVTVTDPDGKSEVKEFNVGATFTVYTALDISSSVANGMAANVAGSQTFPTSKLQITDSYDPEYGEVEDVESMFPILGDKAMATVQSGTVTFSASKPQINNGFVFNSDTCLLMVTHYKVTATGKAAINTTLRTLVASDEAVTKIVWDGKVQSGKSYVMHTQFTDPSNPDQPTEKPTTKPTTKPTEAPTTKPTTKPTESSKDATVTIYGIDGNSITKSYNIGDTFTVYSTFNASKAIGNGMIASLSGAQNFTASVLKETDTVDEYGVVADSAAMFPIMQGNAIGRVVDGAVKYNASTPFLGAKGYQFDTDESLLTVTNYKVIAKGNAEIRDSLTTVAAADANLTRIVSKGEVTGDNVIGGKTTFTPPGTTPTKTILLGDADGSGEVDAVDATVVQRAATRVKVPYSEEILMQGDVDGDGELTVVDATFILRFSSRAKTPYPIGEYVEVEA